MLSPLLTAIQGRMQAQLAAGPDLIFDEAIVSLQGIGELLDGAIGSPSITIKAAILGESNDVLTVNGTTSLLDPDAIPVVLTLSDQGGLVIGITLRLPSLTPAFTSIEGSILRGRFTLPAGLANLRVKVASFTINFAAKSGLLEFADTGDLDVAGFLTIRQPKITISSTGLDGPAPAIAAVLEGLLIIANVPFQLRGQIGGSVAFSVDHASADLSVTSEQLLSSFLGSVAPQLPKLPITDLGLHADFDANDYVLTAALVGSWILPLGISPPTLSGLKVTIRKPAGSLEGALEATIKLAGQDVAIQASLPGDLVLSGSLPSLNLTELVGSVAGPVLKIPPGVPPLQLGASRFIVRFDGPTPGLAVSTMVSGFGTVMVLVAQVGDGWNALVAFAPPPDWTFSRLSGLLAPLDAFQFRTPRLIFSSFSLDNFPIPEIAGVDFGHIVRKGVEFDATLKLGGHGLDFLAKLLGTSELPLQLLAVDDLSQANVTATLGRSMELVPTVVFMQNLQLAIKPSPLSIFLQADVKVVIQGEVLPEFRLGVGLSEGSQHVVFETIEPWVKPFGISGLTVTQVVLDVQTAPAPLYGVLGDVAVAGRVIRIACQFAGSAPTALIGELQGRLSVGDVIKDLVGVNLVAVLDLSIEDFSLHIVADPLGVDIGDNHFEPGLSLRGTLGIIGLEMLVVVRVRPDKGVFAHGELKNKVQFGTVLVISDASGTAPPSMTLDTTSAQILKISGRIALLGLSETLDATVDRSGFSIVLQQNLGISNYSLTCSYDSPTSFGAAGSYGFGLNASIPTDIGKIVLNTGLTGDLSVSMQDGQFQLTADASFSFVGTTLSIPTLKLTESIESLEDLPDRIRSLVIDRAQDIFKSTLEDPSRWVQAIAAGAIAEVDNAARILQDRFQKDADFIGRQLKTVLLLSSLQVAQSLQGIGQAPESIAKVLKNLGDQAGNIRDALERIGVPDSQISSILSDIFPTPHADFTTHVDTHADTPIIPPVQLHVDTTSPPVLFHSDEQAVPHIDAHTDTPIIPPVLIHVDTSATPHGDVHVDTPGPHGDAHGDVHGDAHGDHFGVHFHGDSHAGPHTDFAGPPVRSHTDIPGVGHIDAHTDTPGHGHADIHIDAAAKLHVDAHTDVPPNHADAHTDTPGQGHVDAHGDTIVHTDAP
jgi:hypothetical protein